MFQRIRKIWAWFRIPRGPYCYTSKGRVDDPTGEHSYIHRTKVCPYWDKIEDLPEQYNGYCHYLKRGDWERQNDYEVIFTNMKTGEKTPAPEMPIPVGLLWDQVKECGIKEDWEEVARDWYFWWRKLIGKRNSSGRIKLTKRALQKSIKTAKEDKSIKYVIILNQTEWDTFRGKKTEFEIVNYLRSNEELERFKNNKDIEIEKIIEI